MRPIFRASSPDDRQAIAELCKRVLYARPSSPLLSEAHMAWKYWHTWPGFDGARSFVLEKRGAIVAHAAVVPIFVLRDGNTHQLLQLLDWAAAPEQVGAGVSLLKHLAARGDGLVNVRGSDATQRILGSLGYRSLGNTTRYVLRLPGAAEVAASRAGVRLKCFSANFDAAEPHPLEQATSNDVTIVPLRSVAQMQALCRCPAAPMRYFELWSFEQLIGCFLLCQTPGQQRLVDAWARDAAAWQALLLAAVAESGKDPSAREVVSQTNDVAQQAALAACGFCSAGEDPLHILCDERLVPEGVRLRHQLVDSDLAYLHHDEPESWADEAAVRV